MKKIAVLILAFLYIATSTGANLYLHYCMGELADWGIGKNESRKCGFCGMEKGAEQDNGCCKDEQKFIKNDTDQKFVESSPYIFKVLEAVEQPFFSLILCIQDSSVTELYPVSNAPPRCKGQEIYIRNRTFLI